MKALGPIRSYSPHPVITSPKSINPDLYFRDGLADLSEDALFLILRQRRPRFRAEDAGQARDDQIWPLVAFAFNHDFRNRDAEPSAKLRQRNALGHELAAQEWWENLQDQPVVEPDDEIGPGRKQMRIRMRQSVTARDIERNRQALRRVGAPCLEGLEIRQARQ